MSFALRACAPHLSTLVLAAALFAAPAPARSQATPRLPPMQRDPTGQTPLNVPVGWEVQVAGDQAKSLVLVAENPASKTSPTLGLVSLSRQQGATVQTVMAPRSCPA